MCVYSKDHVGKCRHGLGCVLGSRPFCQSDVPQHALPISVYTTVYRVKLREMFRLSIKCVEFSVIQN